MPVQRKTVSFAQQVAIDRHYDPYVYGGNWNPFNRQTGTDCSGCVVDELDGSINGTAMEWTRHGLSTEDWRPPSMGGNANPLNGPFGTVMVNDPSQFPPDAAVLVALHHGPGGGANSHMWCQVGQLKIETHGSDNTFPDGATVLYDGVNFTDQVLDVHNTSYANNWWFLPGPIVEDGTPIPHQPSALGPALAGEPADTLFADVSEFQCPLDDSYWAATYQDQNTGPWNYSVISIRSNDGDHVDKNFAANYPAAVRALNDGRCKLLIVYYYWRPGSDAVNNHMQLVQAQGGPHPKMVSMIDLESGDGNPSSDVSKQVNSDYYTLQQWLHSDRRVIGYGNLHDERTMWQTKPQNVPMILAGYGTNPNDPSVFKIAHQYTDGGGYGGGLPEGVAPFGKCDMNSADGFSPSQLASALGVGDVPPAAPPQVPAPAMAMDYHALTHGWPQLGTNANGSNLSVVDFLAKYRPALDALLAGQPTGSANKTALRQAIPPTKKPAPRKPVPKNTGDGAKKSTATAAKKTPPGRPRKIPAK
jgi:hypothetical protein